MGPAVFGSSIAQVNILVSGIIASLIGTGKISLLYYSDRIMELPLSLFGIAIATVTMPYLSRLYSNNSMIKFSDAMNWSIKIACMLIIPAAIGLFVLAEPIIAAIFYGGMFDSDDVFLTALSLKAFSIGLIGFSFVKILSPAYFARKDTLTPVKIGIYCLLLNIIMGSSSAYYLDKIDYEGTHLGLALSISVAAILNAVLLFSGLKKKNIIKRLSGFKELIIKLLIANSFMLIFLTYTIQPLEWWLGLGVFKRFSWLAFFIFVSVCIYVLILSLLGMKIKELRFQEE